MSALKSQIHATRLMNPLEVASHAMKVILWMVLLAQQLYNNHQAPLTETVKATTLSPKSVWSASIDMSSHPMEIALKSQTSARHGIPLEVVLHAIQDICSTKENAPKAQLINSAQSMTPYRRDALNVQPDITLIKTFFVLKFPNCARTLTMLQDIVLPVTKAMLSSMEHARFKNKYRQTQTTQTTQITQITQIIQIALITQITQIALIKLLMRDAPP